MKLSMHNLFAICQSVVSKTRHYQITEVYSNSFDWCMPVNPCLMPGLVMV